MILYSVTIAVESGTETEWLAWMREVHIPEVLGTGCFETCRIHKVLEPVGDEAVYQLHYRCRSLADYERYCEQFAPALQKDHTDRFAGRFRASRQILEELAPELLAEDAST